MFDRIKKVYCAIDNCIDQERRYRSSLLRKLGFGSITIVTSSNMDPDIAEQLSKTWGVEIYDSRLLGRCRSYGRQVWNAAK